MEQFLNQDIVYVSNDEIDKAFWAVKEKNNATKIRIKEIFRELKFYKGLDFEFIKVFNKAYFDKNAKILLEIIQMWQGLRLTSSGQNQFLGDMFEYFLDNGRCYENYTENGSHSSGIVCSEATNASQACVIWPINHYLGLNRHPDVINAAINALQK